MTNERVYHGDGDDAGESFADVLARSFRDFPPERFRIVWNETTGEYETQRVES